MDSRNKWSKQIAAVSAALALVVFAVPTPDVHAVSLTAEESKLRAATILGILRFTFWPEQESANDTLEICAFGSPPSLSTLVRVTGQPKIHDRPVHIRTVKLQTIEKSLCHVLILGEKSSPIEVVERLARRAVPARLTICDDCGIKNAPVMIDLVRNNDRIGFRVDLGRADTSGISFSSALLELAVAVRR